MNLPRCAVCDHPVERLEHYRDAQTRQEVYTAYCHGAVERVALTAHLLQSDAVVSLGVAFGAEQAAARAPKLGE